MPFVSITRLRLGSIFRLIPFMRANNASIRTLIHTPGLIVGKELLDKGLTFWTLTIWEDDASMRSFRNSAGHRKAMQKLPYWCNEASYSHWTQESRDIPDWATASKLLLDSGKITKVRNPTERQLANNFPPIRWMRTERVFKPLSNRRSSGSGVANPHTISGY